METLLLLLNDHLLETLLTCIGALLLWVANRNVLVPIKELEKDSVSHGEAIENLRGKTAHTDSMVTMIYDKLGDIDTKLGQLDERTHVNTTQLIDIRHDVKDVRTDVQTVRSKVDKLDGANAVQRRQRN